MVSYTRYKESQGARVAEQMTQIRRFLAGGWLPHDRRDIDNSRGLRSEETRGRKSTANVTANAANLPHCRLCARCVTPQSFGSRANIAEQVIFIAEGRDVRYLSPEVL